MTQIVTSVKNTFVHVDVDNPDCHEMRSNARRRASCPALPDRVVLDAAENEETVTLDAAESEEPVTLDAADNEKTDEDAFDGRDFEEVLLLPHDDDDYASMHAHPGPSPLEMDAEGCHVPETTVDDPFCDPSISQAKDEATPDFVNVGMGIDDALSEEMEDCCASASACQGLTYGARLPNGNYGESLAQNQPCLSAAPTTPYGTTHRETFSTFPSPLHEAQRGSYTQSYAGNSHAGAVCNEEHEETQGEEKRTTVILANVPLRYTSSKLMRTIDSEGFASMYDFIYVPMTTGRASKGYAFVNWLNPSIAQRFISAFDGFSRWSATSKNVCRATWAKQHQGLQVNIDRYRNSSVLGKTVPNEYKPRIFKNGEEVPFPPPTRKLAKPGRCVGQPRQNNSQ